MDISTKSVKDFLDAVDAVLNSNTFILEYKMVSDNMELSLMKFLNTDDFINQLVQQDKDREWYNIHYFDNRDACYKVKPGSILANYIDLKITFPPVDKNEYLIAMLMGDTSIGNFCSFYSKQKERQEAELIIGNLISFLAVNKNWDLFVVKPDFLKFATDRNSEGLIYFEGDYGNDTATIIKCNENGYLILTNGID